MTFPLRRIVTGHDEHGNAVVKIDEIAQHWRDGRPGGTILNVWTTDTAPANNSLDTDGGMREGKFTMIQNGSVFRILDFKPGLERRMHRTDSIDYIVVMSGEIDMELDNGVEVHLKQGDVMVQRGTIHNWINRGTETCIMAVILIHADPVNAGGKVLNAHG
jgi:quercetin dioxygenase-like cupin family protein